MKRWLLGLLVLLCMVSMVACSKSAPSLEGEWQAQDALKKDYTIVIVTHSMQQAARASDYTGFFYLGNLIEYDKTSNIFQNAKLQSTNDYVSGHFG